MFSLFYTGLPYVFLVLTLVNRQNSSVVSTKFSLIKILESIQPVGHIAEARGSEAPQLCVKIPPFWRLAMLGMIKTYQDYEPHASVPILHF